MYTIALNFAVMWSGRYYVLAIDYDRYLIAKHCPIKSNKCKYMA